MKQHQLTLDNLPALQRLLDNAFFEGWSEPSWIDAVQRVGLLETERTAALADIDAVLALKLTEYDLRDLLQLRSYGLIEREGCIDGGLRSSLDWLRLLRALAVALETVPTTSPSDT